jgi:hypothetical protein
MSYRALPQGKWPSLPHCIGVWAELIAGLEAEATEKYFASAGEGTPVALLSSL